MKVIDEIRKRNTHNLSLCTSQVRKGQSSLVWAACKYFSSWEEALLSSGFSKPSRHNTLWSKDKVIQEIQKVIRDKIRINSDSIRKTHPSLFYAGIRYFGSWKKSVFAAGEKYPTIRLEGEDILCNIIRNYFPDEQIHLHYRKLPWLIGPKGWPLELDLYLPNKNLAFEFQGIHHYIACHGRKKLEYIQLKDIHKLNLCLKHGLNLIVVPYYELDIDKIHQRLLRILPKLSYPTLGSALERKISLYRRLNEAMDKRQKRIRQTPKYKNLASEMFTKQSTKRAVDVSKKHKMVISLRLSGKTHEEISQATGYSLPSLQRICRKAGITTKNKIWKTDDFRVLAKKKGGELLDGEYSTKKSLMTFRCKFGHEWTTLGVYIKSGSWCPQCGHKRLTYAVEVTRNTVMGII